MNSTNTVVANAMAAHGVARNAAACNDKWMSNSVALNFSVGDKVSIIDTDIRYGGDKGEVVRKDGYRYIVRLTSRQDKPEVYFFDNQLKALNACARNDWEQTYTIKGLPVVMTYRGSPFNDIKATVKGGNRDWIEVARVVASNPVSQAEAEKMVAPKWTRIKRTAPNACARNANGDGAAHLRHFQDMAKAAINEILYAAEGELRVLTGNARECAEAAKGRGDAKTVNDIARILSLLKDAVRKHHSDCLRTIG